MTVDKEGTGFVCPDCSRPDSLHIELSLSLPGDSRSDEICLQTVACADCGFDGLAVYEESRRGALDSESWDHSGYRLDDERLGQLSELIASCPRPDDTSCQCPAHRALGRRDDRGRWSGLDGWGVRDQFLMLILL